MGAGLILPRREPVSYTHLDVYKRQEVVTMYGENLAEVVAAHANLTGVTNVIIGKTRNKKHLKDFFKEDFEDQLISLLKHAELHIIPDSDNRCV